MGPAVPLVLNARALSRLVPEELFTVIPREKSPGIPGAELLERQPYVVRMLKAGVIDLMGAGRCGRAAETVIKTTSVSLPVPG